MRSPGKSGCGFFQSDDKRLMLKTISRTELRVMQERLGEYIAHCKAHPGTLLARVYGLFQLTQRQVCLPAGCAGDVGNAASGCNMPAVTHCVPCRPHLAAAGGSRG